MAEQQRNVDALVFTLTAPVISRAAFSAIIITVALGWALGSEGITLASATRKPATPWTCSAELTTLEELLASPPLGFGPMRQVPAA